MKCKREREEERWQERQREAKMGRQRGADNEAVGQWGMLSAL